MLVLRGDRTVADALVCDGPVIGCNPQTAVADEQRASQGDADNLSTGGRGPEVSCSWRMIPARIPSAGPFVYSRRRLETGRNGARSRGRQRCVSIGFSVQTVVPQPLRTQELRSNASCCSPNAFQLEGPRRGVSLISDSCLALLRYCPGFLKWRPGMGSPPFGGRNFLTKGEHGPP